MRSSYVILALCAFVLVAQTAFAAAPPQQQQARRGTPQGMVPPAAAPGLPNNRMGNRAAGPVASAIGAKKLNGKKLMGQAGGAEATSTGVQQPAAADAGVTPSATGDAGTAPQTPPTNSDTAGAAAAPANAAGAATSTGTEHTSTAPAASPAAEAPSSTGPEPAAAAPSSTGPAEPAPTSTSTSTAAAAAAPAPYKSPYLPLTTVNTGRLHDLVDAGLKELRHASAHAKDIQAQCASQGTPFEATDKFYLALQDIIHLASVAEAALQDAAAAANAVPEFVEGVTCGKPDGKQTRAQIVKH